MGTFEDGISPEVAGLMGPRNPRLKRTRQCAKCPWKVSTDPYEIPHGYDVERHKGLSRTIANPGSIAGIGGTIVAMSCHEHPPGAEVYCVGWLMNQLGPGNNIPLRMALRGCDDLRDVVLDGEQHERFEDTLP